MMRNVERLGTLASALMLAGAVSAASAGAAPMYEVTVTNITRNQRFTPILAATHTDAVRFFTLGSPASPGLSTLAEEGNVGPLAAALAADPGVADVVSSPAPPPADNLIAPGESVILTIRGGRGIDRLSLAAMLIPTNDAFFALNGVELPRGNQSGSFFAVAYDAGSERNDELCESIPGPGFSECGGDGGGMMPSGGEEGFVHVHQGIHGIGDLLPSARDWRNPVAHVTVQRVRVR
jgi:hypothetical protein